MLSGCEKEEIVPSEESGSLTLKASMESVSESKVAVSIDKDAKKVAFSWIKGDVVAIHTSAGFENLTLVGDGGSPEGRFTGSPVGSVGDVAVYPSHCPVSLEGRILTLELPSEYSYVKGETHALMCAPIKGEWMRFRHLASLLKIDIVGVPAGASLVVTASDRKINGTFTVDWKNTGAPVSVTSPQTVEQSSVTVSFSQAESLAEVYVPMPVGEYPSLSIKVLDKDGKVIEGSERTTSGTKVFARGHVKSMPKVEMKLPVITLASRAYRMEKVEVTYSNISSGEKVLIDFGDGTDPHPFTGSGTVVHQFDNTSGADKTYTVTLTTNGQSVQGEITVYPLMALTEAAKRFKDPACTEVWVMAHRSNTSNKSIPENSISAVKAAIAAGVDMIEIDTHITSDKQVVVCHDQTINRTTTGTGDITTMTLSKIQSYKLKDRNGKTTTQTMPTLKQVLEAARGKIYVNLDYSPRTATTAQVMSVVKELGMTEQVLFYCNSADKVSEVIALEPSAHPYTWNSDWSALKELPGNYFVQYAYAPDTPPNLGSAVSEGMICTVNMLTDVSDTSVDSGQLNQLFGWFPFVRIIHTDVSDMMVQALKGFAYTPSVTDYFVTPAGAGSRTGLDWNNAFGMAELRTLLRTNSADNGAKLDGVTFHCAGGKYITVDNEDGKRLKVTFSKYGAPVDICFKGGYAPSSTGKDLSKRNISAYETDFTGDFNGNGVIDGEDTGLFCLDSYAFLTFDGVTFSNAYGISRWRQGAFVMNSDSHKLQLTLNNCKFTDLNTCSTEKDGRGAALFVLGNSIVKAVGCTFNNCKSYGTGGAICVDAPTSKVELDRCVFTSCQSSASHGGAIAMNAAGLISAQNCTFDGCKASISAGEGAAIYLASQSPELRLNGCVFKNGKAWRAGAISQADPSLLFMNACTFHNNTITNLWGNSIVSYSNLFMSNCTLGENLSGGNIINGGGNWCIVSTTAVSRCDGASSARNTAIRFTGSGNLLIMNSIALYANSADNMGGIYSESKQMDSYGYNRYDKTTNIVGHATDISGQSSSVLGMTWNNGCYLWGGPSAVQPKASLVEIENVLKTGVNRPFGNHINVGKAFYDWLQVVGEGKNPLAYDQLGNARNTSGMWPGAYEK